MVNWLEYFKSLYSLELERRKAINDAVAFHFRIISISFVSLLFFIHKYYSNKIYADRIFLASIFLALIFLVISCIFLMLSYHSYKYAFLPLPEKIYCDLEESRTNNTSEEFEGMLTKTYANNASINMIINEKKSRFMHYANISLMTSMAFMLVAAISYFNMDLVQIM